MAKYKIAIDAGHASNTAGKRHPDGYREHWSNVKMAYFFNEILLANGDFETIKVGWNDANFYDDNVNILLADRQKIINKSGALISISFHANAYGDGKSYNSANGVCTYLHNDEIKAQDSLTLAKLVQSELIKGTTQKDRHTKKANFAMCNCTAMGTKAAILIESAFMTNERESALLKTDAFCLEVAEETAQGLFNYLGYDGNVKLGNKSYPDIKNPEETIKNNSTSTYKNGDLFKLSKVNFYSTAYKTTTNIIKSGTFYIWDSKVTNNRIRLTNKLENVGNKNKISGWVNICDLVSIATNYKYKGIDYSLVFDPIYYSNKYSDLKKAFGDNNIKLFNHFTIYGMKEGRVAKDIFDVSIYKANYTDLQQAFGDNLPKYYEHYIKFGYKEGRKAY